MPDGLWSGALSGDIFVRTQQIQIRDFIGCHHLPHQHRQGSTLYPELCRGKEQQINEGDLFL